MRALAASVFLLLASATGAWSAECRCLDPHAAKAASAKMPKAAIVESRYNSFRGISFASKSGDVAASSLRNGLTFFASTFINMPDAISMIDICRGDAMVAQVAFDESGRVLRMMFHAGYFYEKPIGVRDFAEAVFKHYKVVPEETEDDACFQDVTCFRGRTKAGENFLILKIGGEVQLFVRPLKPGE